MGARDATGRRPPQDLGGWVRAPFRFRFRARRANEMATVGPDSRVAVVD